MLKENAHNEVEKGRGFMATLTHCTGCIVIEGQFALGTYTSTEVGIDRLEEVYIFLPFELLSRRNSHIYAADDRQDCKTAVESSTVTDFVGDSSIDILTLITMLILLCFFIS